MRKPTYYWKSNITIGGRPGALLKIQRQKQRNKLLYVDKIYTVIISVCLIVCPTLAQEPPDRFASTSGFKILIWLNFKGNQV